MQSHAGFQFYRALSNIVASHPSFQQVLPGRKMLQAISARCVRFLKVGRLEDQGSCRAFSHEFRNEW